MNRFNCSPEHMPGQSLKLDAMARWIEEHWKPRHAATALVTVLSPRSVVHHQVLARFDRALELPGGVTFAGGEPLDCDVVDEISDYNSKGDLTFRTGAFVYRFKAANGSAPGTETGADNGAAPDHAAALIEVAVLAAYFTDEGHTATLACLPRDFVAAWSRFGEECGKIAAALDPEPKVRIIGGRASSFEPTVEWDDVILPADLKGELMKDVESFFVKGVDVYKRLKLKPFRKLLLAGVPGTGKTMLCSALAKWALARDYLVIYISSNDYSGAAFWKIEEALRIAANSEIPALILLEELDAYVKDEDEKALVLNVLDGAESKENDHGTLLVGTTNYPEAIDERVLKRPGRLDRIFIIPETRNRQNAEDMLRMYLGDLWRDELAAVTKDLVGYPGAFIREVALYALTQVAYDDLDHLPLDLLKRSYDRLLDQITAKDNFITEYRKNGFGFVTTTAAN